MGSVQHAVTLLSRLGGIMGKIVLAGAITMLLAGCQSLQNNAAQNNAAVDPAQGLAEAAIATAQLESTPSDAICSVQLRNGPPPKPSKGADFAKNGVGKNVGRNAGRSILTQLGGRLGGGIGAGVASGAATSTIRTEQDMKGKWLVTDGRSHCACNISISSGFNLQMTSSDKGKLKVEGCSNPALAASQRWRLGHTFTGYNASFELLASDNTTVLATMRRDGLNYSSGTLPNGEAVTMWRRGGFF